MGALGERKYPPPPGPWALRPDRACNGSDADFFPGPGQRALMAKAICGPCPVRDACRGYALDHGWQIAGVWGGLTEHEREEILRRRDDLVGQTFIKPRAEVKHGTEYAYKRGCRCTPCRDATNEALRRRKAARRERLAASHG